jgi:hypothetical protein
MVFWRKGRNVAKASLLDPRRLAEETGGGAFSFLRCAMELMASVGSIIWAKFELEEE